MAEAPEHGSIDRSRGRTATRASVLSRLSNGTSERLSVQQYSGAEHLIPGQDQEPAVVAERAESKASLNRFLLGALLVVYIYFDSSISLWTTFYKKQRVKESGSECPELQALLEKSSHKDHPDLDEPNSTGTGGEPDDLLFFARLLGETKPKQAQGACGSSDPVTDDEKKNRIEERKGCPWYLLRKLPCEDAAFASAFACTSEGGGCSWNSTSQQCYNDGTRREFDKKPHTFTKGAALSFQATCGLLGFWTFNFYNGGMDQLKLCFDIQRSVKFAPIGALFGLSAVFGFKAQMALSPGSYALYSQSGIVLVPILWRIVFNKPLAVVTWMNIMVIAAGLVMYRISEVDMACLFDGIGLFYVMCKVGMSGLASILAEMFLKGNDEHPFTVQVSYILPWKILSTFSTIWLLDGGFPDRHGGFFHDWNLLTLWIIANNLGDTVLSSVVAKTFDSVVKAVCGVVGIICPTFLVSLYMNWEQLPEGPEGQLKVFGGVVVILGSLAYVKARQVSEDPKTPTPTNAAVEEEKQEVELGTRR